MTALLIAAAIFGFGALAYNAGVDLAMRDEAAMRLGAEPLRYEGDPGKPAVLLIHGYIGTPADLGRLPELLRARGYTVDAPLLPGHGTHPRDFAAVSPEQLTDFVIERYDALAAEHERVYVAGFSMGGALATLLAAERDPAKLVLLAPYYEVAHQWYYVLPVELHHWIFSPLIPYVYKGDAFKQINDRAQVEHIPSYRAIPMRGIRTTLEIGRRAKAAAAGLRAPLLAIHSRHDKATDYKVVRRMFGDRLMTVERSNHILLWDYDREAVERAVLEFLE